MKATGADGYYIQHNHPSGNPIPSGAEEYAQSGERLGVS
jgi:DNA repair protein RadC